jgi:hypothetical protein
LRLFFQTSNDIKEYGIQHWLTDFPFVHKRDQYAIWPLAIVQGKLIPILFTRDTLYEQ